ncbi:MAG: site-2 protease family protein [candidate division SR1 bacterium CG_4_9_14_3_um_filter_40_9]|nr:MAG: site-2 protease family protein [candidate division SR1 bacterium CG_4_9_14_3_um_filter_40_9]
MGIVEIIQLAIILAVSIGLHEYAHAYTSNKLGDPTPKLQGRLTPNPLRHIDPIGFLMIFLIHFGRGKPVQINPMYYKHPLKGELLVSLAGPATNLALAIAGILIMLIYAKITGVTASEMINMPNMVITFRALFAQINIALAIFNILPIYPLDGYRLIKIIRPQWGFRMEKNGMIITIVFLFLLIGPGSNVFISIISNTTDFIFRIFFTIFGQTFY